MFATIYKYLPHARPDWSDVGIGAVITAGLFTLGKYLIGLYLGTASIGSTYGAAGSFVVLLVWIYYSSLIVLFGAEFTQVYAQTHGSGLTPAGRRRLAGAPAPVHT
jgi:membrane protein